MLCPRVYLSINEATTLDGLDFIDNHQLYFVRAHENRHTRGMLHPDFCPFSMSRLYSRTAIITDARSHVLCKFTFSQESRCRVTSDPLILCMRNKTLRSARER